MRFVALALAALLASLLAACSPAKLQTTDATKIGAAAPPLPAPAPAPETLAALAQAHNWEHEDGKALNDALAAGASRILKPVSRADAIKALNEAGYECIYGEASETYLEPMAVCTRSFATRACQMTWEIASTADKGRVQDVDATFTRDCVGVTDDWPEPKKSAIDDQLAPAPKPKAD